MSSGVVIDEDLCVGCGLCAAACHQGAIVVEGGKAKAVPDNTCDGLGRCLPVCPAGAISFQESKAGAVRPRTTSEGSGDAALAHWPLQMQLVRANAPFFDGADLLVAADCTAFACEGFRDRHMKGKVTVIGCPKLDECDYSDKLAQILRDNDVRTVTVARMDVPCCAGIVNAAQAALKQSGKDLPLDVVVVATP